jgi:hypothetical protein
MPPALIGSLARGAAAKAAQGGGGDTPEYRIDNQGAFGLIALSLFFDAAQLICIIIFMVPFVGPPISLIVAFLITCTAYTFIWLSIKMFFKGVEYFGGSKAGLKMLGVFGSLVIEILPFLGVFPTITAGTIIIIVATRLEDEFGSKRAALKFVATRRRDQASLVARHQQKIQQAREQDTEGGGGKKNEQSRQKKNVQEKRAYDRRIRRQNFGMVRKLASGGAKKAPSSSALPTQSKASYGTADINPYANDNQDGTGDEYNTKDAA